jgi:hypothetical protein
MARNNADYSDPSSRLKLNTINRLQMLFRRLIRTFENLAIASDYSCNDLLNDRIATLDQRIALLEEKVGRSEQNESL